MLGLARLAVDRSAQSKGIGAELLHLVVKLACKMADEAGCAGIVVDAKPGAVDFHARYGFAPFEQLEGQSEGRPLPIAMYLMMHDIKAATERAP
jgi:predicted N-acetyltransferase YhbS